MRVLFFTTSGSYHGGGVMCLIEMLEYIRKTDCEPYVIIPTHGSVEPLLNEMKIPYGVIRTYDWLVDTRVRDTSGFKKKRAIRQLINKLAEKRFYQFMKKNKIEAFHLNSAFNPTGVKSAKKLNIPVIWHLREFAENGEPTPVFDNADTAFRTMASADVLVAVSDCIKAYYQSKMPGANIVTIYDGIKIDDLLPTSNMKSLFKGDTVRLTSVGGIAPIKGFEDAISAVARCRDKFGLNCTLTIVGRMRNEAYLNKLHELADDLGIADRIAFYGECNEMSKIWKQTDIVLVCSKSESFGRVAVEAMANGLPVIGANNTGTSEILPVECQYQKDENDALVNKICEVYRCFESGKEAEKLKVRQSDAKRSYNIERSARELLTVIRECFKATNS